MKFKFKDYVKILDGFYKDWSGIVIDYQYDGTSEYYTYLVHIYGSPLVQPVERWIHESQLKIEAL